MKACKNGKMSCDDCPSWKSSKICAHAIALAEKVGALDKYVKWLQAKGPSAINLTALVTCDSDKGVGKKGGEKSTARRKGGRTAKNTPVMSLDQLDQFLRKAYHRRMPDSNSL